MDLMKRNKILIAHIFPSQIQLGNSRKKTNSDAAPPWSLLLILRIPARRDNERPWVPVVAFSPRSKSHEADSRSQGNNRRVKPADCEVPWLAPSADLRARHNSSFRELRSRAPAFRVTLVPKYRNFQVKRSLPLPSLARHESFDC